MRVGPVKPLAEALSRLVAAVIKNLEEKVVPARNVQSNPGGGLNDEGWSPDGGLGLVALDGENPVDACRDVLERV